MTSNPDVLVHEEDVRTATRDAEGQLRQLATQSLVFLRQNQRLFKDGLKFTVHWVGLSGDRAVAQWTNAGTTRTGKAYANRGVTIFRVENDKIVEIQDHLDTELLTETWPD